MAKLRGSLVFAGVLAAGAWGCGPEEKEGGPTTRVRSAITTTLFKPYVAYPTASMPTVVAIADLNGDGRNDVALATAELSDPANDNTVHVFLQAADGTLSPRVKYPVGASPYSMDVGDLNGDGRTDVVVGSTDRSFGGLGIRVLLQNPSGGLDAPVVYPTNNSSQIKVGDFNSDGRLDVAGINAGLSGNALSVLLQTEEGTLAAPVTYSVPHGGLDELDAADLNADGRTDLVVTSGQLPLHRPQLSVLLQQADGTMAPPATYSTSTGGTVSPRGVALGDANGDGLTDVVVSYGGNYPGSFIGRLLQNGQGTLDSPVSYSSLDMPSSIVAVDVDSDNRKDFLVTHGGWTKLGVYRQTPSGDFGAEELYFIPYASAYFPQGLVVGDIDSDGLPDAVIADSNHGLVVLRHVDDVLPTVAITAPSGGAYLVGAPLDVTWTASDNAGLGGFDVSVSFDGGATFAAIAGCTGLPGTARACPWSTPGLVASGVRVKVTARDTSANQATAESSFDLVAPSLAVTAPAGGSWLAGTPLVIAWSGNLPASAPMIIELSRDGGATFETLAAAAPNTGGFNWMVTGPAAPAAVVRVTSVGGASASAISGAFGIVMPAITLAAPGGGETLMAGTTSTIAWSSNLPPDATIAVELSRDGGISFETLAAAAPNTGSFGWVVTGPATPAAVVRISANSFSEASAASGSFAIVVPTLTVTAPVAGAAVRTGAPLTVSWNHNLPAVGTVHVELSRNGGASFATLASAVPDTGSFAWVASGPLTTAAVVRVTAEGALTATGLSGVFAIESPAIVVTAPAVGTKWTLKTARAITWTSNLPSGDTVRVELSRNGGTSYTTLAAAAPNSGSYTWTASGSATTNAVVRVSWNGGSGVRGTSGRFSLVAATLTVTAPNTNVIWNLATTRDITWTHNVGAGAQFRIEVSRNGGSTWSVITAAATAAADTATYAWTVTGPKTERARIRVTWLTDTGVNDRSNVDFRIR